MAKIETLTKKVAIDKANTQMVIAVSVAVFVFVFCVFAAKAIWSQNKYQARVITAQEKAHNQLQKNLAAYDTLSNSYKAFDSTVTNVIGGTPKGTGDNDGTNTKIILDALPSSYDFPALTSSIEKIMNDRSIKIGSITGTDDEVAQQGNTASATPEPQNIPFSFTVSNVNYASVQKLIDALQHSIRPFQIDTLNISGGSNSMTVSATAHTYFQPAKTVSITKKEIK